MVVQIFQSDLILPSDNFKIYHFIHIFKVEAFHYPKMAYLNTHYTGCLSKRSLQGTYKVKVSQNMYISILIRYHYIYSSMLNLKKN